MAQTHVGLWFIYDFENVLQETDGNLFTTKEYTSTAEQYGELVSSYENGQDLYFETDALGSTDALLTDNEFAQDRYTYRAFGLATHTGMPKCGSFLLDGPLPAPLGSVGSATSAGSEYNFVGRQGYFQDVETGLYWLRKRPYDPATSQFTSEDPIGYSDDVNLYRYCRNNPVNITDPSGLQVRNDSAVIYDWANEADRWKGYRASRQAPQHDSAVIYDWANEADRWKGYRHQEAAHRQLLWDLINQLSRQLKTAPPADVHGLRTQQQEAAAQLRSLLPSNQCLLFDPKGEPALEHTGTSVLGTPVPSTKPDPLWDGIKRGCAGFFVGAALDILHAVALTNPVTSSVYRYLRQTEVIPPSPTESMLRNAFEAQWEAVQDSRFWTISLLGFYPRSEEDLLKDLALVSKGTGIDVVEGYQALQEANSTGNWDRYHKWAGELIGQVGCAVAVSVVGKLASLRGAKPSGTVKPPKSTSPPAPKPVPPPEPPPAPKPVPPPEPPPAPKPVPPPEPPPAPPPASEPKINQGHIFHGEINKSGKAVGYHHREGGVDPATGKVTKIIDGPNAQGVYTARVEVFDPVTKTWVEKGPLSSFYPDSWSQAKVLSEIQGAFASKMHPPGKPANYWEGVSPSGVRIGGYTDAAGNINTAFPIYKK